ncbi:MAG: hypothetical protein ACI4II_02640 [Acutalibacteraceae bacterium]
MTVHPLLFCRAGKTCGSVAVGKTDSKVAHRDFGVIKHIARNRGRFHIFA